MLFLAPIAHHLRPTMSNPVHETCFPNYELRDQQIAQFKVSYGAFLMSGIHSFLVVAFALAVQQLRRNGLHTNTKKTLLASVIVMFLSATALLAGMLYNVYWVTTTYLFQGYDEVFLSWDSAVAFNAIQAIAFTINVIVGQAIVLWHTWVIWERRKWVLGVAIGVMFLATIATWIVSALFLLMVISASASLGVNFWCTAMIIGKTKLRPRAGRNTAAFAQANQPATFERLFVVTVESGLAYTFFWALFTAAVWSSEIFGFLMQSIMSIVVVLHPTLLVLLLASNKTLLGGDAPSGGAISHRSRPSEQHALRHVASPSVSGPYADDDNATLSGSPKVHGKTLSITSV
ncbi:hypothetical protein PENSPDRAFT_734482 [Peniophora sp. CONT]|nr:hypothetical protein PENSPDRAFT_734482 [Peniophora sp. CONT]